MVGFLASLVAMIMGWIPDGEFNFQHALLLCASSMCTAALASFVLGELSYTVKPVLSGHSKIDKTKVLKPCGSLMQVKSIAECSHWSILQYF